LLQQAFCLPEAGAGEGEAEADRLRRKLGSLGGRSLAGDCAAIPVAWNQSRCSKIGGDGNRCILIDGKLEGVQKGTLSWIWMWDDSMPHVTCRLRLFFGGASANHRHTVGTYSANPRHIQMTTVDVDLIPERNDKADSTE
jgi:hypothetical protein